MDVYYFIYTVACFGILLHAFFVLFVLLQQGDPAGTVQVQPNVDWNDLVNGVGAMALLEWQVSTAYCCISPSLLSGLCVMQWPCTFHHALLCMLRCVVVYGHDFLL